jgi:flagellar biosynthetic protein FliO
MAAVIVVLTLLGGCMFLLKKRGIAKTGPKRMEVIEKLSLNPQTTLHLVRIGDQTLLLATSAAACNLISNTCPPLPKN